MDFLPSEIAWLERFFAVPNELTWGNLNDTKIEPLLRDELNAWLSLFSDKSDDRPVLLPRLSGDELRWYACSSDPQTIAQLREEIVAFVGNSYARVEMYPDLDPTNPCESALLGRYNTGICTIDILPGCQSIAHRRFEAYRQLVQRRPKRPRVGVRPVGRVRFDFDKALLAGQFDEARVLIEEMKSAGRLSLENQRFLEIRLLAAQGKWKIIVGNPSYLRSVIDLALPARILADLVEAVYQVFLQEYEESANPQGAIATFKEVIYPKYGRLFRARKGLKTPSVLKAYMLDQLTGETPELAICQQLVDIYPIGQSGFDYIQTLLSYVPQQPIAKDVFERAKEAFDEDKIELALKLYASCPTEQDILKRVLRCSRDVEATTDLQVAWDYCQKCPAEWFQALTGKTLKDYEELKDVFAKHPISNWMEWVTFVIEGGDRKEAEKIAKTGATEWSLEEFLAQPDGVRRFCEALSDGVNHEPEFFQGLFPTIYEFISGSPEPNAQLRPLYGVLLELLACSDSIGESDLILAQELIRVLFDVGISSEKYQEILEAIELFWANVKSFKHLDWAMDMAELLAISPSPKPDMRTKFFNDVLSLVATNAQRVEPSKWMMLQLLGQDYGADEYVGQLKPKVVRVEGPVWENRLAGKKVGIYSLTEPAAIRAKQLLEEIFPGVSVGVNHDHEATQALESLAKSSDLFVFAWRSSKHQAFYCVKKHVEEGRLILPSGKGSTSIVNSIMENITNI